MKFKKYIVENPYIYLASQTMYKFPNNYGASVVCYPGTYGYEKNLKELAVVHWENDEDWYISYSTPITTDVLGWLTDEDVEKTLEKIFNL